MSQVHVWYFVRSSTHPSLTRSSRRPSSKRYSPSWRRTSSSQHSSKRHNTSTRRSSRHPLSTERSCQWESCHKRPWLSSLRRRWWREKWWAQAHLSPSKIFINAIDFIVFVFKKSVAFWMSATREFVEHCESHIMLRIILWTILCPGFAFVPFKTL